ncbi:MAG TPA: pectin acetylesterase-family hydrolase [Nannocystaceae bacterium]|nr:pectin acetylesterase-family hydrolase [Nannocystaceae bacterium]
MRIVSNVVVLAGVLCGAVGCSGAEIDPFVSGGDDVADEGAGSATHDDSASGDDTGDAVGDPGAEGPDDEGGVDDGGDETQGGADDGGPDLPDLDCDPQPLWYLPKDPLVTEPLQLRQWRWIAVPEMRCANDTTGGFFVNSSEQSRDLVVFFGGGGVCYDPISCALDTPLLLGMGPAPLETWLADLQSHSGIFDRFDPGNPFRDASYVFFPHCTGDGHTADKITMYVSGAPIQQVGYRNVQEGMRIIAPTFEHVERVTVAGFSAGGIGSLANYHQIAWLFECLGHAPPLLIDDAGPVLRKPYLSDLAQGSLTAGWGLDDTFGELCPECDSGGYHLALQRIRELHPGLRSALVNAYGDSVVRQLYSALTLDLAFANDANVLRLGLLDYASWTAGLSDPTPATRHRQFFYWGERHGALVVAPLSDTPGLAAFLQAQLDDAPQWSNVHP